MSTGSPAPPQSALDKGGPWLMVFLIVAVAVLITWLMLSLFTGGSNDEQAGLDPGVSPQQVEVPVPPQASPSTTPVTPPAPPPTTRPATTAPAEPSLVDRFPLGQRQGHDTSNDDRRSAFGEIGSHCYVGEECGGVPAGAAAVNEAAGGTAGLGSALGGGASGSSDSGSSSGSGSGTSGGGVSIAGGGGSADTASSRNRRRVSQGQIGSHCFVGEDCPAIPDSPAARAPSTTRTLSGTVVPCGEVGVHSRVGESQPCANGVINRVGTRVETLPTGTTIGLEGRCYMVTERTTVSATVVVISCPTPATIPVSAG